jgi:hypothetical protein
LCAKRAHSNELSALGGASLSSITQVPIFPRQLVAEIHLCFEYMRSDELQCPRVSSNRGGKVRLRRAQQHETNEPQTRKVRQIFVASVITAQKER